MKPADLSDCFQLLHEASRRHIEVPWPLRQQRLQKLADMLHTHREAIQAAISADFGRRSRHETDLLEMVPTLEGIRHALRHGKRWMRPRKAAVAWPFWPAKNRIVPQPVGVVGVIAPWNYPIMMAAWKIAPALAAGNTLVFKPSEHTPLSILALAPALAEILPRGVINIICGGGEGVGSHLVSHPKVRMVSLTGDIVTGQKILQAAAKTLKRTHLELGGKAPVIVCDDADLDEVVNGILGELGPTNRGPAVGVVPGGSANVFARALGISNHTLVHGKAPEGLDAWPDPDAIFIGGSGGELADLIALCLRRLRPGGWLVMNFVTLENLATATQTLQALGATWDVLQLQAARSKPILHMHRMAAENPVWIVCAQPGEGA